MTWLRALEAADDGICVLEIAAFEVRRELLRLRRTGSAARLNMARRRLQNVPVSTPAMLLAFLLWAQVRQLGLSIAAPDTLDVDVLPAAQATTLGLLRIVVTTVNAAHLSRLVQARQCDGMQP